jgi:hypothetical protein
MSTTPILSHGVGIPRTSAPQMMWIAARRNSPMKIVRMIVTNTGRPMSGRNTPRSMPADSAPVTAIAASSAANHGSPSFSAVVIANAPNVSSSPCAKLNTCDAR